MARDASEMLHTDHYKRTLKHTEALSLSFSLSLSLSLSLVYSLAPPPPPTYNTIKKLMEKKIKCVFLTRVLRPTNGTMYTNTLPFPPLHFDTHKRNSFCLLHVRAYDEET